MSKPKKTVYWDTCVFLYWLRGDSSISVDEKQGMEETVRKLDQGKITLVTSVITLTEISLTTVTNDQREKLLKIYDDPRCPIVSVTRRIADLAHNITLFHRKTGISLTAMDAMHLATAIYCNADEFHTFDGPLLSLSGNVGGHRLIVCKPSAEEPSLL